MMIPKQRKFIGIVSSVLKHKFKVKDLLYLLFHVNKVLLIARNQRIDEKVYSTVLNNFLNYYQTHGNGGNNYIIDHIKKI